MGLFVKTKLVFALCTAAIAGIAVLSSSTATPRADIEVIVSRHADYVELFIGMPAKDITPIFAVTKTLFTESDGSVEFSKLREGTYDRAEIMFDAVETSLNGSPVRFEAMSMMFHPSSQRARFETPLDAAAAISVCDVLDPARLVTMDDLHSYSGFIAFADETDGKLTLKFPVEKGETSPSISIRSFDGSAQTHKTKSLQDGTLTINL